MAAMLFDAVVDSSSEISEYAGLAGPPDERCFCSGPWFGFWDLLAQ